VTVCLIGLRALDSTTDKQASTGLAMANIILALEIILILVMLWLICHMTCSGLFKICICSFDCLAIVVFAAMAHIAYALECIHVLNLAGISSKLHVVLVIAHSLCRVAMHACIGMGDAIIVSRRAKVWILLCVLLSLVFQYVYYRFRHQWSEAGLCLPKSSCMSYKAFYLQGTSNELAFSARLFWAYARGCTCAVLRTSYLRQGDCQIKPKELEEKWAGEMILRCPEWQMSKEVSVFRFGPAQDQTSSHLREVSIQEESHADAPPCIDTDMVKPAFQQGNGIWCCAAVKQSYN